MVFPRLFVRFILLVESLPKCSGLPPETIPVELAQSYASPYTGMRKQQEYAKKVVKVHESVA